jgi:DNA-binding LytR/AlgR family response regulator
MIPLQIPVLNDSSIQNDTSVQEYTFVQEDTFSPSTTAHSSVRDVEQMRLLLDWLMQHEHDRLQAVATAIPDAIALTFGGDLHTLRFDDILYCSVEGNYSTLHSSLNNILCNNSLSFWEKALPAGQFLRVGKSYLVNVLAIQAVERWQSGKGVLLTMTNGTSIKVSRNHLDNLRAMCGNRFPLLKKYARAGGGGSKAHLL